MCINNSHYNSALHMLLSLLKPQTQNEKSMACINNILFIPLFLLLWNAVLSIIVGIILFRAAVLTNKRPSSLDLLTFLLS